MLGRICFGCAGAGMGLGVVDAGLLAMGKQGSRRAPPPEPWLPGRRTRAGCECEEVWEFNGARHIKSCTRWGDSRVLGGYIPV